MDYGSPYGPGAPPSIAEDDPIGALLYQKSKKREQEMAQQAESKKSADMQRQAQDQNRARQELENMQSGRAIAPPSIPQAHATGQLKELVGDITPQTVKDALSNNVEQGNSEGHGPSISIGFAQGTNFGTADQNAQRLSGGARDFTSRLSGPDHVDLQALTQGSLAQDDILQQEMIKRGQAQQTLQGQAEHLAGTDLATAQEDAARAKAGIDTQDPYYPQHLQSQTAIGVAGMEGNSKIQAARQPRLVERETEQLRMQQFAQAKDQAFRELQKNPKFVQAWNSKDPMVKKQADAILDRATSAITEPMKQGMTRYSQRDTGFELN